MENDFSGIDFTGVDFGGANPSDSADADFNGIDFSGVDFGGMDADQVSEDIDQDEGRSFGEIASDTGASVMKSFANLGGDLAWIADKAWLGGNSKYIDLGVQKAAGDATDYWEEAKSDKLKASKQPLNEAEGVAETLAAVAGNPEVIPDAIADSAAYLFPTGIIGRIVGAGKYATALMAGTEGLLEGSNAAREAESRVLEMTPEKLAEQSDEYAEMVAGGMSAWEAKESIRLKTGLTAFGFTAPIAALAGKLTGASKMEVDFFSGKGVGKGAGRFATNVSKQGVEEIIQEGANAVGGNLGIQTFADRDQDLTEGVGKAAAMGAIAGMSQSAPMSALQSFVAPVDNANEQIKKAADDARAAGGDSLDAAVAAGETQAQVTPNAVSETQNFANAGIPDAFNVEIDATGSAADASQFNSAPENSIDYTPYAPTMAPWGTNEVEQVQDESGIDYTPPQGLLDQGLSLAPREAQQGGIPYEPVSRVDSLASGVESAIAVQEQTDNDANMDAQPEMQGLEPVDSLPVPTGRLTTPEHIETRLNEVSKELQGLRTTKVNAPADPKRDELMSLIAKLGGLNTQEAKAQGIDPAHNKEKIGKANPFRKDGKSFDGMAETLSQYGFFANEPYTANRLLEMVGDSLAGRQQFSTAADDHVGSLGVLEFEEESLEIELSAIEADLGTELTEDEEIFLAKLHLESINYLEDDTHEGQTETPVAGRTERAVQPAPESAARSGSSDNQALRQEDQRSQGQSQNQVEQIESGEKAKTGENRQKQASLLNQEVASNQAESGEKAEESGETIAPAKLKESEAVYRDSIMTPVSKRSPEQLEAKRVVDAVKKGEVAVDEAVAEQPLSTAGAVESASASELDIKQIVAKQMPDMTEAELQAAIVHYGPGHKRTKKLERALANRQPEAPISVAETEQVSEQVSEQVAAVAEQVSVQAPVESDQASDQPAAKTDQAQEAAPRPIKSSPDTGKPAPDKASTKLDNAASTINDAKKKAALELKALLDSRKGTLNSGVDPEVMLAVAKVGALTIADGTVKFAVWVRDVLNTTRAVGIDDADVRPFLKEAYGAISSNPEKYDVSDELADNMDLPRDIRRVDIDSIGDEIAADTATEQTNTNEAESAAEGDQSIVALADHLLPQLDQLTDNRKLKAAVAEFYGVKPSEASAQLMKTGQEAMEFALVQRARQVIEEGGSDTQLYKQLLELYANQPNLNVRSSSSMQRQAYSTPAPLAFLSSRLAGITESTTVYEPTAGNGMLLIGAPTDNIVANELDNDRADLLEKQGIEVTRENATEFVPGDTVDSVIMNPPFGRLKDEDGTAQPVKVDGYTIKSIDHLIAVKALEAMRDDGKATMIIGASKSAGEIGAADRTFFNWLYRSYNVTSHFEVDGDLYNRQGAGWPVRVITINGREASARISPKSGVVERAMNWSEVYEQYERSLDAQQSDGSRADDTGSADKSNTENVSRHTADSSEGQNSSDGRGSDGRRNAANTGDRPRTGGNSRHDGGQNTDGRSVDSRGQSDGIDLSIGHEQQANTKSEGESAGTGANPGGVGSKTTASRPGELTGSEFQTPYKARSNGKNDKVLMPTNMAQAMDQALDDLENEVGNLDSYVQEKLGYDSKEELHESFMALQVDAVAATIRNIENNKGTIIADQTGVGKGRQAAAIIRYARRVGKTPIFMSVAHNLFSDMYSDLKDIGVHDVKPFIVNRGEKITYKERDVYKSNSGTKQVAILEEIARTGEMPEGTDTLFLTYHQVNTDNLQRKVIDRMAENAIFILDEAHNIAGDRTKKVKGGEKLTTSGFVLNAIKDKPVVYLSATYAKRPDNMPAYYRTDLSEAVDNMEDITEAVIRGGLPLQAVISNDLVRSGQLFRRERSFEGISINTSIDTDNTLAHEQLADKMAAGLSAINQADKLFHAVAMEHIKEAHESAGGSATGAGNRAGNVDHNNFSGVIHNYIGQLLLGLKVERAAAKAVELHEKGVKPVIGLENTMGSFLFDYVKDAGLKDGDPVDATYNDVLLRALERSRRYSVTLPNGDKPEPVQVHMHQLDPLTRRAYQEAEELINDLDIQGIPLSPIDLMRYRMEQADMKVSEITGRNLSLDYSTNPPTLSKRDAKEQKDKRGTVDAFNGGRLDGLVINVAGSTGLSIHASEKFKDKKPRHMIIAQSPKDINILMQMLGRINRTGQVKLPGFTMMGVDIPAEKRPQAVTSKKMKSLNANTSANDKSDTSVDVPDIMNKYGDKVVQEYLQANTELASELDLSVSGNSDSDASPDPGLAMKFTGRLARTTVETQKAAYDEIETAYAQLIDYLTKTGQNDLDPQTVDLDAKILGSKVVYEGKSPTTIFGGNTTLHKVNAKYQGKPPTAKDVREEIAATLKDKSADEYAADQLVQLEQHTGRQELLDKTVKRAENLDWAIIEAGKADGIKGLAALEVIEQARLSDDKKTLKKYNELAIRRDLAAESIKNVAARLDGSRAHTKLALSETFKVGDRVMLDLSDEVVTGVATGIKIAPNGKGDAYSLSKTRVSFMVDSGIRNIELPLSKLQESAGIFLKKLRVGQDADLDEIFKGQKPGEERRENRFVATGNLIAGSADSSIGGRIVSFSGNDARIYQGILLPRRFEGKDFDAAGEGQYVALRDKTVLLKFLKNNADELRRAGGVFDVNQTVRLTPKSDGRWLMTVPKANKSPLARKVKFDKDLISAMGMEFFGSGKTMEATFDASRLKRVTEALTEITQLNALPSLRPQWESSGGNAAPKADKTFADRPSVSRSDKQAKQGAKEDDAGAILFSKRSILPEGATPKGMTVKEVEDVAKAFFKKIKGGTPLALSVARTQSEVSRDTTHRIKAGYDTEADLLILVAANFDSAAAVRETLRHEILVHKGLGIFAEKDIQALLNETVRAAQKPGPMKDMWESVQKHYADESPQVQAEELLAKVAEVTDLNPLSKAWNNFVMALRRMLINAGWLKANEGLRQMKSVIHHIADALAEGKKPVKRSIDTDGDGVLHSKTSKKDESTDSDLDYEALKKLGLGRKESGKLRNLIQQYKDLNFKEMAKAGKERAYEGVFDGLVGIKRAEDAVGAGAKEAGYANSGYIGARLSTGIADTMHAVLHYGAPEWSNGVLEHRPGTKGVLSIFAELGEDLNDWLAWMGGNRGAELLAQGRENNLTQDDIDSLIARSEGKEEAFEAARVEYNKLNKAMLDLSEDAGMIDPVSRAKWESEWYVPFYRQDEAEGGARLMAPHSSRGLSHQTNGIKALKGGESATNDLLENILTNWMKLVDSAMKNSALLKTVDNLKDSDYLTDESLHWSQVSVPRAQVVKHIKGDRAYLEFWAESLGMDATANELEVAHELNKLDTAGYEELWSQVAPTDPDVIRIKRKGKSAYYRVHDEALLRAVSHLGNEGNNSALMRGGRWFKRLLTIGVTSSPDFMLRNFVRDAAHAWAINPDGFRFGVDSFKGVKDAFAEDDDYRQMMFAGASFQGGYVHGADPEAGAQMIRRALEKEGLTPQAIDGHMDSLVDAPEKVWHMVQQGWQHYRTAGDKMENSNRLSTFKAAKASGKTPAQALYEAKDLMDYSLRGNWAAMNIITDLVPFLNARLQGLNKLGRAGIAHPKEVGIAVAKIAMASVALAAWNDDDERYKAIPDWDKDAYWHFFIGEHHFRVPKPFEIGIIAGTLPERAYHAWVTDSQPDAKLLWSFKHGMLETLGFNPTPQAVMPILELWGNKSFHFDTPIESMSDRNKLPADRHNAYTSDSMVVIGQGLGLSPKQLQHLWKGYTGTMGAYALSAADMLVAWAQDKPTEGELLPTRIPVLKSFYRGSGPARSTQYSTDMYDRLKEANQIAASLKDMQGERRKKFIDENRGKLMTRKLLKVGSTTLRKLRQRRDAIVADTEMTAKQKQLQLDKIQEKMNDVSSRISKRTDAAF